MGGRGRAGPRLILLTLLSAAALAGCGGGPKAPPGNRITGRRLDIYLSVPLHGVSAVAGQAVANGAAVALRQIDARIGRLRIVLRTLDDTLPGTAQWSPGQTQANARAAIADPATVGYIGDYNSGASAVSIPLLNRFAIPQISPYSTAVGLTSDALGASPGEPQKYDPTGLRTFVRVVPNDLAEARTQIALEKGLGCRDSFVVDDGEFDGQDSAAPFTALAPTQGLRVLGQGTYESHATSYLAFAQSVAQLHPECILFAATPDTGAAAVMAAVARQLPDALLFGTAELAVSPFTTAAQGGIPSSVDHRLWITAPAGDPGAPNAVARRFLAAYAADYGGPDEPVAIDGYEAMSLLLDAIRRATHGGRVAAVRTKVVAALFRTPVRDSALGSYRIRRDGDPTLDAFAVYRVVGGQLRFTEMVHG